MKLDAMTAVALAFAGYAAYTYTNAKKGASSGASGPTSGAAAAYSMATENRNQVGAALGQNEAAVTEIFDAYGKTFANQWRYFSDGNAIDPDGNYYHEGKLIWSPA